jgi:serine/threonine protein kinase
LLAPGTQGDRSLARFEREVQLTAGLTHPSTIAIYDYGRTAEGVFYYAMELLRGINLLQLVEFDGPLPPARVVYLLRQACGALAEAHAAGLIHRDIKPANLMICICGGSPDFLKVLDFGPVKDVAPGAGAGSRRVGQHPRGVSRQTAPPRRPRSPEDAGSSGGCTRGHLRPRRRRVFSADRHPHSRVAPRQGLKVDGRDRRLSPGPEPCPLAGGDHPPLSRSVARTGRARQGARRDAQAYDIAPPWKVDNARAWWRDRGEAALAAARARREEPGQVLILASGDRAGS